MTHIQDSKKSVANARALYYDFFAGFFLYELLSERTDVILEQIKILKSNPLDEKDLIYFENLEKEISNFGVENIMQEYTRTFLLPFAIPNEHSPMPARSKGQVRENPQIMLYLSHYIEGCLNGSGLLKARTLIKQTNFRLNAETFKESEEHFGFLLLLMRYLLLSNDKEDNDALNEVLKELVLPLGEYVATALLQKEDLHYYSSVGNLLRSFLIVEQSL
ncbi:hypothetical protein LS68_001985 [Helicobacter sp. MIT 05-5293]|uniref:molecular chaperone TorD family protein n=1 Tax=Helicobacter sp. MIT 05-5293 TaxID=1548149 RepID=UPI00051E0C4C|nr:molecular chaperone TorD family protein [Helicobacter sp. MIT 05-5293]TLD81817.1 hypothetical protein LS68_001985 [Helicobacter sp. MIT 05-5293]